MAKRLLPAPVQVGKGHFFLSCLRSAEEAGLFHPFLSFSALKEEQKLLKGEVITPEGRFFLSPLISYMATDQELTGIRHPHLPSKHQTVRLLDSPRALAFS